MHCLNLGPACLLGSHCIVLVHHYLDTMVHCCPGKLWEGAGEQVAKVSKQRQRRSKRRHKQAAAAAEGGEAGGGSKATVAVCTACGVEFPSRNQLFKHIKGSEACADATAAPAAATALTSEKAQGEVEGEDDPEV